MFSHVAASNRVAICCKASCGHLRLTEHLFYLLGYRFCSESDRQYPTERDEVLRNRILIPLDFVNHLFIFCRMMFFY